MAMPFPDGVDMASVMVSALGSMLAQLRVSATNHGVQPAPMAAIVDRILAVCGDLGVDGRRAQPPCTGAAAALPLTFVKRGSRGTRPAQAPRAESVEGRPSTSRRSQ